MKLHDLFLLVGENLGRRAARVALTAIGVVIGTSAIVVLVSLGIGLQRNATDQLGTLGDLTLINVYPIMAEGPYGSGGPNPGFTYKRLITDDTLAEFAAFPGVVAVVPREYSRASGVLHFGRLQAWAGIMGMGTDDLAVLGHKPQAGALTLGRGSLVIGSQVAAQFYDPNWRPGMPPPTPPDLLDKQLRLVLMKLASDGTEIRKTYTVRVTGIIAEARTEADWSMYMSLADVETFNQWLEGRRVDRKKVGYGDVLVKVGRVDQVLDVADRITAMELIAYTPQQGVEAVSGFFTVLQVVFGAVGAIALLVAAIGIANTMAMAILERTREIGLMKAVGATNLHVLGVFLGEAAAIGLLGGLGGIGLGWSAGQVINVLVLAYYAGQAVSNPGGPPPPAEAVITPLWLLLASTGFATLTGFLSGVYPALRAANLVPVKALKHE